MLDAAVVVWSDPEPVEHFDFMDKRGRKFMTYYMHDHTPSHRHGVTNDQVTAIVAAMPKRNIKPPKKFVSPYNHQDQSVPEHHCNVGI